MPKVMPSFQYSSGSNAATHAVRAGNLIFVGGLLPLDAAGAVLGTDITTQAEIVFDALERTLAVLGASIGDVVKHNVFFTCAPDEASIAAFMRALDAVRVRRFPDPGPTTTEVRCGLDRR